MEWIDRVFSFCKSYGEVEFSNSFFEKKRFIYEPVRDSFENIYSISNLCFELEQAKRVAPLLKKRIIDEGQPLNFELRGKRNFRVFDGGRISDATLLGQIRYFEACPELFEAASHDVNEFMRAECVLSLGEIGNLAHKYSHGLCQILLRDKSFYVRGKVAESLGKIKNISSEKYLVLASEESRDIIRRYPVSYRFSKNISKEDIRIIDDACNLLEHSIVSINKLNPKRGREVILDCLNDSNDLVHHWAKRASFIF